MSEQETERLSTDEEQDEVEAHKRRVSDMQDDPTASGEESSEDFEAHKKR